MDIQQATINELLKHQNKHILKEMAEIARINKIRLCVYAKEGYIQHFHIYTPNGNSACLRFKENAYFPHDKSKDKLEDDELKQVVKLLKMQNEDYPEYTNWQVAIKVWNRNNAQDNEKKKLETDLKMPNYKSPEYKLK